MISKSAARFGGRDIGPITMDLDYHYTLFVLYFYVWVGCCVIGWMSYGFLFFMPFIVLSPGIQGWWELCYQFLPRSITAFHIIVERGLCSIVGLSWCCLLIHFILCLLHRLALCILEMVLLDLYLLVVGIFVGLGMCSFFSMLWFFYPNNYNLLTIQGIFSWSNPLWWRIFYVGNILSVACASFLCILLWNQPLPLWNSLGFFLFQEGMSVLACMMVEFGEGGFWSYRGLFFPLV